MFDESDWGLFYYLLTVVLAIAIGAFSYYGGGLVWVLKSMILFLVLFLAFKIWDKVSRGNRN